MIAAALIVFALTRAEIIERFKAPVVNQADGFVQVLANCPADLYREYQTPVARFAAETVKLLYGQQKPRAFKRPALIVTLGSVRTNITDIVTNVSTNEFGGVETRLKLVAPGHTDLKRYRREIVKAFARTIEGKELDDAAAEAFYRERDPATRILKERNKLLAWFDHGEGEDEEGMKRMYRIVEPGFASQREILFFASRLFLYPPYFDQRFAGRHQSLSFREAIKLAKGDLLIRYAAIKKAPEMALMGGGRGEKLQTAAYAYLIFLTELAKNEKEEKELAALLEVAELKLNLALEEARKEGR